MASGSTLKIGFLYTHQPSYQEFVIIIYGDSKSTVTCIAGFFCEVQIFAKFAN